ncbi:15602_t:CDS:2, partial [Funneliformis mosseae]
EQISISKIAEFPARQESKKVILMSWSRKRTFSPPLILLVINALNSSVQSRL